jgi:uncharacterized protein
MGLGKCWIPSSGISRNRELKLGGVSAMRNLNCQEVKDLIWGCTVLGTGGGGNPAEPLEVLPRYLEEGKAITLAGIDEVPEDAFVATPYGVGGVEPVEGDGCTFEDEVGELYQAFVGLEAYTGKSCFGAMSIEIGGGNTAAAIAVAALRGIPIIDADPAGRSVPGVEHTTFFVHGIPIEPMAIATIKGDLVIVEKVSDDFRAEEIARAISITNYSHCGVADHLVDGHTLKQSVIHGALSYAMGIGRAIREARESMNDPVQAAISAGDGYRLFAGTIASSKTHNADGFTFGDIAIDGTEEFDGDRFGIWYKNENIMSWYNDVVDVTVPDLICVLDRRTGEPITNPNCISGMDVVVVGYRSPAEWRTPRGMLSFGPKSFGHDIEYKEIESLQRLKK